MARPGLSALLDDFKATVLEAEAAFGRAADGSADAGRSPDLAADPGTAGSRAAAARALDIARRHPLALLAGVAALGYVVGRFSRSRDRS